MYYLIAFYQRIMEFDAMLRTFQMPLVSVEFQYLTFQPYAEVRVNVRSTILILRESIPLVP